MRAVIYARVATEAQGRRGVALDSQESGCRDLAKDAGWTVVECIRDVASGLTLDRPGIGRLRELVRDRAVDVVVGYSGDRFSRDLTQLDRLRDELRRAGARAEFVVGAEGEAIARLLQVSAARHPRTSADSPHGPVGG